MQKNIFKNSLVVGIIMLFIGASVIPSMGNSILVNHDLQGNKTTFKDTRSGGYIQDLIDNASDGDTIFIPSGIYYEHIIINKTISLVGEDKNTTVIDGNYSGNVVTIVSDLVNISGFTIQNSGYYFPFINCGIGILSNNNTITGNTISNNDHGIDLSGYYGSSNNIITDNNIISNNGNGILLHSSSSNNIITGNNISSNNYRGISLSSSCNNNIITDNNIILNNYDGIYLKGSSNIVTGNNIISNNKDGIHLDYIPHYPCNDNIIIDNTISNNNGTGIHLSYYSDNNLIYHNNLINNEQNAYDPHSNTWYNAELQEGNYWSDYTGIDFNSDGIGDIPYDIPGGSNQDLYPFMEPDGWLIEPEFRKAFIFGKITNLIAAGKYITFEAVKTLVITFKPFSFHKYVSGEKLILSNNYLGLIGVRYVFALCEIVIKF